MSPPINIDGSEVSGITVDGTSVSEVTVDGETVFGGISVVEGFKDGDLAEWSGDTGIWSVNQTSPVPNGSFRLEKTDGSAGVIRSSSGLNNYPERGDVFAFQLIPGDSLSQPAFEFFGTSSSSSYDVLMSMFNDEFAVRDRDGFRVLDSASLSWTIGQEYTITIDTSAGNDIVCTATDESDGSTTTISGTDDTYNSTSIGIRDGNGQDATTGTVWDYIRITDRA